ncbi:MAG: 4Fe-4S dicluster-binding protein [Roseiarcus sp.]
MAKGVKWLPKIVDGFENFMDEHGYATVDSMVGLATRRSVKDYSEQFARNRVVAEINAETCKNPTCNVCIQVCFYEALSQSPAGAIDVHLDNCIGCELCYDICPFDSIRMTPANPEPDGRKFFAIPPGVFEKDKFKTAYNNPDTIRRDSPKFATEPAE